MEIIERIQALDLPPDGYVVIGSSILSVLGIIEASHDIDFAFTPDTFAMLQQRGWQSSRARGTTLIHEGDCEGGIGLDHWSMDDLRGDAIRLDDVPFISLAKLHAWKANENRPKDRPHLMCLDDYLARHAAFA